MKAEHFRMIDYEKPVTLEVTNLRIKYIEQTNPDLSYLTDHMGGKDKRSIRLDNERLADYDKGRWRMMGIVAECSYIMPISTNNQTAIGQDIQSAGLWQVESDSDKEYLAEIEGQEIEQLKEICTKLGIAWNDKLEPVRLTEVE